MKLTDYQPIPVQIVGQSYEHRSRAQSIQRTMNLIPQKEFTGAGETTLVTWPGIKDAEFSTIGGANRGMFVHNGLLYKVNDTTLYEIASDGTATSRGTVGGVNRCIFETDGTNMIITTGSTGYQYTGTTLTAITDTDFQNGNSVTYLNTVMIYDGNDQNFQVSSVGDPDSIPSNNTATAASSPDDTSRVKAFKERFYIFGEESIETWQFTGTGNPPVGQIRGGTMNIGLGAIHSIAVTDEYCYFLGDDRRVYRFTYHQPENITSIAISHQIDELGDVSGAIADIVRIEGQSIYILSIGTKTFAFNEDAGAWFNLSTGADEGRYIGESFVEIYNKRLCASKDDGNVYELALDTYQDNGDYKIQERIFGPITANNLQLGHQKVTMSRLWLHLERGVGLEGVVQGTDPQLMVSASFDDGNTFVNESDVLIGRTGESNIDAKYDLTRTFDTVYFKVRCSDPVFLSIYGATLESKPGGI